MDEQLLNTITSIVRDFEQKHNLNIKIMEKINIAGNHFGLETQLTKDEFKSLDNDLRYMFNDIKNIYDRTRVYVKDSDSTSRTVTYIYSY